MICSCPGSPSSVFIRSNLNSNNTSILDSIFPYFSISEIIYQSQLATDIVHDQLANASVPPVEGLSNVWCPGMVTLVNYDTLQILIHHATGEHRVVHGGLAAAMLRGPFKLSVDNQEAFLVGAGEDLDCVIVSTQTIFILKKIKYY